MSKPTTIQPGEVMSETKLQYGTNRPRAYDFHDPDKNAARNDMLAAMEVGPVKTSDLRRIGRRGDVFDGVVTGMIGTLKKKGIIRSPKPGWWTLADGVDVPEVFHPETVGDIETITPVTTRVGDTIVHAGVKYVSESMGPTR